MWCSGRNESDLWRGCVGYWPLWAGAGALAHDLSGYGHDGTLTGMDPPTDWVATEMGRALAFNGSTDYVLCPNMTELEGQAEVTLFFLAMRTSASNYRQYYHTTLDATHRMFAQNGTGNPTRIYATIANGTNAFGYTGAVLPTGIWHSIAIAFNGGGTANADRLKIFYNGMPETLTFSGTLPATTPTTGNSFALGNVEAGSNAWPGPMALTIAWTRVLLAGEIASLAADPFCMIRPRRV